MRVLLVRPYNKESLTVVPPLGLGYLATALRKKRIKVKIVDCVKEKILPEGLFTIIKTEKPDIIGFTVFSSDLTITKMYLKIIKTLNPQIMTVIGGPHPSAKPHDSLEFYQELLDFAFIGEAEIGFPNLVEKLKKKRCFKNAILQNIPGLIWRQDGVIKINKPEFAMDLDTLDFPSWDLIKPETYPHAPLGGFASRFPVGYILTSRSCPFQCTFCAAKATHGSVFRQRTLASVMKEVRYLIKKRGIKELHILDDNFTLNRYFVKEFCQLKIKEKLNFTWNCSNGIRLDMVDEEILRLMKEAGCYSVSVGVESGSSKILKHMQKNLKKKVVKKQVNLIRKVGLDVTGLFIIGYPEENKKDIMATISFAKELNLTKATFSTFIPLPGSKMWNILEQKGRLGVSNFDKLSYYSIDNNYMKNVSQKEFRLLQKKAFWDFYFRPRIFWTLIKQISSPAHLFALSRRLSYYFKAWFIPRNFLNP